MEKVAALYSELSADHQKEVKWALDTLKNLMPWGSKEIILDLGCGPGDVLYNILLPWLPKDFHKLIGIDKSKAMIDYATNKRTEESDPRISFLELDICKNDPLQFFDAEIQESHFTKVFSFFCMHWIKEREHVLQNIHSMLQSGGYAFIHMVVRSDAYQVWDKFVKMDEWKEYFKDVETPINDYVYMDDYEEVFCSAAEKSGFRVVEKLAAERKKAFPSKSGTDEDKIRRLRTVDPLACLLPEDKVGEYLKQVLEVIKKEVSPEGAVDYTAFIVLLKKES